MPNLNVRIEGQGLEDVRRLLSNLPPEVRTRILNRVLNDASTFARRNAVRQINMEINLSQANIRRFTNITRSNFSTLQSRVTFTGSPIPLILFNPSRLTNGLSVRVRKTGARERLPQSFIATLPRIRRNAGGTIERIGGSATTAVLRRQFNQSTGRRVGRLPIQERFGPSVPSVFEHNGIEITVPVSGRRMTDQANRQIEAYLRRF